MTLTDDERSDARRWLTCSAIVLCAYVAAAGGLMTWRPSQPIEAAEPAGAIMIDFAPLPAAPQAPQNNVAPGPEQVMSEATPKPEMVKPDEDRQEKLPEMPNSEVALKAPEPAPQPDEAREAAPTTSAPQAQTERSAVRAAAPTEGRPDAQQTEALATWKSQLMAAIERNKRYPEAARAQRAQGIAQISFALDRQGRVIETRLVRGSGATALDEEALAIPRRAQPFPVPPQMGERIVINMPIRFTVK
ncbi:energy transducer TonB [Bradyrhizobium prioriisuperbiae]|uniref:energy transducer TonB n=1 Tax=Bradyrhizobium prioriisuperbiae TaxID=2854389 RepID=UPI0028E47AF0|nr:energy transducer TonB [Bradyrhizobium prioritasuperba]